jgi:hypothetical protein
VILLGIENLKESCTRIPVMIALREFVDLVEENNRIEAPSFTERLGEDSWATGYVRSPMPANLGLVADAPC